MESASWNTHGRVLGSGRGSVGGLVWLWVMARSPLIFHPLQNPCHKADTMTGRILNPVVVRFPPPMSQVRQDLGRPSRLCVRRQGASIRI